MFAQIAGELVRDSLAVLHDNKLYGIKDAFFFFFFFLQECK